MVSRKEKGAVDLAPVSQNIYTQVMEVHWGGGEGGNFIMKHM